MFLVADDLQVLMIKQSTSAQGLGWRWPNEIHTITFRSMDEIGSVIESSRPVCLFSAMKFIEMTRLQTDASVHSIRPTTRTTAV